MARAVDTDNVTDRLIWLQEIAVFGDSAFMEEDLGCLLLLTVIVNGN